jgi:hypothetical protein
VQVLTLSRDYDLPRSIVWDAFVDADLVEGWLPPRSLAGEVTALEPLERMVVEVDGGIILDFRLLELQGGTRGTGTQVTVIATGYESEPEASATWGEYLANLERLLRGHPVDWSHWQGDGSAAAHDAGA